MGMVQQNRAVKKRGISETNPTPTKEPQAARQKTPSTESPVRIAMNSWTTSNLYNKTSQRMASSDHTYLSDDAMECQDEFGSDHKFFG